MNKTGIIESQEIPQTYKELLVKHKILRSISFIQFLVYIGAWFSSVAIYSMLVEFQANSIIIAIVTATHFAPAILLFAISGSIVDRINAKLLMTILIVVEMVMTLCFLLITTIDDVYILILFIFIKMFASSIFFTTEMSLMPKLFSGATLAKANELHAIIWSSTFALGMTLGGFIVSLYGTNIAFILDALLFLVALFMVLKIKFDYSHQKQNESIIKSIKDGFSYVINNKKIIYLMFLHGSVGLTTFDALITLLADYHYKYIVAVPLAIGLSNGFRALALMIGSGLFSNWINKERLTYLFILQGIAIILWSFVQKDFYIALVGIFIVGLCTTTLWSYTYALIQEEIDHKYMGRVLAYNEMIFMLSNITTTIFIGAMATIVDLNIVTIIIGCAFFVVAFAYKRIQDEY